MALCPDLGDLACPSSPLGAATRRGGSCKLCRLLASAAARLAAPASASRGSVHSAEHRRRSAQLDMTRHGTARPRARGVWEPGPREAGVAESPSLTLSGTPEASASKAARPRVRARRGRGGSSRVFGQRCGWLRSSLPPPPRVPPPRTPRQHQMLMQMPKPCKMHAEFWGISKFPFQFKYKLNSKLSSKKRRR